MGRGEGGAIVGADYIAQGGGLTVKNCYFEHTFYLVITLGETGHLVRGGGLRGLRGMATPPVFVQLSIFIPVLYD